MKIEDLTLLTCTFNNNLLTKCMIMSLVKQLGIDIPIVIMDNGTTELCTNEMREIFNVIDNSNYKITGNFGQISRNHCASIDYALKNLIKTKYVLLCDNDILFKPTVKDLIENMNDTDCVGEIEKDKCGKPWRVFPFFCIINVEKLKKENINYFDETRCMNELDTSFDEKGNWKADIRKSQKSFGDTGSSFLWDIEKSNWKIDKIKLEDYILHFAMASWNPNVKNRIESWLTENRNLFI